MLTVNMSQSAFLVAETVWGALRGLQTFSQVFLFKMLFFIHISIQSIENVQ
jgi:hypothetical protein